MPALYQQEEAQQKKKTTYRQGVDHSLEAHVDLAAADDLGHVRWVIGLQKGDLEAFLLEVALGLGKVQGGMVRGSVPLSQYLAAVSHNDQSNLPVGQKGDLISRHLDK